jgi:hypothetical protein
VKKNKKNKKKKFKIRQEPSTPILEPIKRKLPKIILPETQKIPEPIKSTEPKQIQNLRMFNFIEPVFKILLHWFSKGGKIPQRVSNRKSADKLSYYIEELLMDGLNSIYLPALVNEKEDFAFTLRDKKWKVKEITDSIDQYIDKMGKSPKTFNEFLLSNHNPRYGAYSPLIIAYQRLPKQMSWSTIYLKEMIEARFPDITIPDGTFINTGARLEEMRQDYSVDDNGGNLRFDQPCTLFYDYIVDLANEKGTDVLRYMSSENTFEDFFNAKRRYLRYRDPAVTPEMEDQRAFDIIFKRSQRNREAEVVLGKTFYNHLKEYCKE